MRKLLIVSCVLLSFDLLAQEVMVKSAHHTFMLYKIPSLQRAKRNTTYYKTDTGLRVGVSDKILVKLNNENFLEEIFKKYPLKLNKKLGYGLFLLQVKDKENVIQISNSINALDGVVFSHPDFIKKSFRR